MEAAFHEGNRQELYLRLAPGTLVVLFSGHAPRKTADEMYPFFADRSFVYMTGIEQEDTVFMAEIRGDGQAEETLFTLPPDMMKERWTGRRIRPDEASGRSGITVIKNRDEFYAIFRKRILSGEITAAALDFDQLNEDEPWRDAMKLAEQLKKNYPYLPIRNLHTDIAAIRTIKKPCEIEAMKKAQLITRDGILAMMSASRPGLYEYQLKAEYDHALAQHGVLTPMFPSIISAGRNNFCIHYYGYRGLVQDGDMVLNDVGAVWDNCGTDVSRGWPCNGRYNERQRLLYECAYATSNHMFEILKPGIPMGEVDLMARKYCYERLKEIGLCRSYDDIGTYMWHGGAHHVGYDTHDVVDARGLTRPGFVFCVDIGIYCEEWGIGFRLEDNCHITEDGCENLSAVTPRSIEAIEAFMNQ